MADVRSLPRPDQPRRPLDVAAVSRIQSPAQQWAHLQTGRITPGKVASVLRAADQGDAEAYLTLAMEAEERYGHYASVLQTRKLAVVGEEIEISPGDESSAGEEIANSFRENVAEDPCFHDLMLDLMDGVAKGYSVIQPHWDYSTTPWTFAEFEWLDPRFFQFERSHLQELRIRSADNPDGIKIKPGQFITHRPRTRSATPLRAGMIRPITTGWMFQSATVAQWAAFAEVYGMPLRIGKYDPETATQEEIDQLRLALINMGHDAAAIVPEAMKIEILDGRRPPSGDNIFEGLAEYWDRVVSKIILGGTMTSEDGSSLAQAEVHNDVRLDIKRADARALCATLRQQVAAPWTLYNFGPLAPVPKIRIACDPDEDLVAFSSALAPLVAAGLEVSQDEIRERFGLRKPKAGEQLLQPVAAPSPGGDNA